jgi:ribosomal protein S18 acetylase RimI-like enzyme
MIVRKAKGSDIDQIVDFQIKMALETEQIHLQRLTVEKGVTAVVFDSAKGQYYVTEINGNVVGSLLTTYEWSDWRNGTILWIQSVYILPDFRRKGVYRSMYTHIKEVVQNDSRLNGIRLYADKSNIAAHKTYKNLGMNPDHYVTFEWMK